MEEEQNKAAVAISNMIAFCEATEIHGDVRTVLMGTIRTLDVMYDLQEQGVAKEDIYRKEVS